MKAKKLQGPPVPKTMGKGKKKVTVSENIIIHVIESDTEGIDDFSSPVFGRSMKK